MSDDDAPPAFRSRAFLQRHIADTFAFYHPRCIDPAGGFYQHFRDDGSIYDADTRQLVSSTRFVFNYALAVIREGRTGLRDVVRHGLDFLRRRHRHLGTGGYARVLRRPSVLDRLGEGRTEGWLARCYRQSLNDGVRRRAERSKRRP